MSEVIKVKYVGKDHAFWNDLQEKFKAIYPKLNIEFDREYGKGKEIYSDIFFNISEQKPDLVYLDFSLDPVDCLYLGKLIVRENSLKHIAVVGLLDQLAKEDLIYKSIFTGVPFIHIKGGDFFPKVYHSLFLAHPKETRPPHFATAKVDEYLEFNEILRIGYLGEKKMHVEGDVDFQIDDLIYLKQSIFTNLQLPCSYFTVKGKTSENLYYDYRYAYDVEFMFKEEPGFIPPEQLALQTEGEEVDEETLEISEEEKVKHEELKQIIKDRVKKFVTQNYEEDAHSKSTKIMVIDRKLSIYNQAEVRLEKLPYSFRTQIHLKNFGAELPRFQPNLIAYSIDEISDVKKELKEFISEAEEKFAKDQEAQDKAVKEALSNINDQFNFQRLVNEVKKNENYEPFIIIFNDKKRNSATWQTNLGYKKIIALSNPLDINFIINIAKKFQLTQEAQEKELLLKKIDALKKKNHKKFARLKPSDLREKKVFFSKSDQRSWAFYKRKFLVKEINEVEVVFETEEDLKMNTTFFLETNVKFFLTTVEMDPASKWSREKNHYRALIHVIGESELAKLRQFINSFFFKEKREKEKKEKEAFMKKNQEVIEKKAQAELEKQEQLKLANESGEE